MHVEKRENLASGESFSYKYRCRYSDLTDLSYDVEAFISPKKLFHIRREGRKIPSNKKKLSINAYVNVIQEVNLHRWMNNTLKTLFISGFDTTLAEIKSQQERLSDAIGEIREAEQKTKTLMDLSRGLRR